MRLDFIGIALAGLYAVGVYGALCKKSLLGLFSYLIPEHLVKFRAYDFSLLLRVGYSFKSIYKMVLTVYAHEIHIEQRKAEEVTEMWYKERMAPEGVGVVNPAFDVTDHSLVTGIITEKGIAYEPFKESFEKMGIKPVEKYVDKK